MIEVCYIQEYRIKSLYVKEHGDMKVSKSDKNEHNAQFDHNMMFN